MKPSEHTLLPPECSSAAAQVGAEQESIIFVTPEEYEWLWNFLETPAMPAQRLRAALELKPIWDES